METKVGVWKMKRFQSRIGLQNGIIIPSEGRNGGLALLWERELDVELKSYTRNHIDAIVTDSKLSLKWRMTGFYGNPDTNHRKESWNLLHFLNSQFQMPWVCLGDFNEILYASEKSGGPERSQQQMDGFRRVVNACGFHDLGFEGPEFTWCNRRTGDGRIQLRLDRVFASSEWRQHYSQARVIHVVDSTSDHCALILTDQQFPQRHKQKRFHFEAVWIRHEKCREIVQETWRNQIGINSQTDLIGGLKECAETLTKWSRNDLGFYAKKIKEKRKHLQEAVQADRDGSKGDEIDYLRKEINELLDEEEIRWNQRSRVD